jgi:tetratricopeptide (TPR) repeat protein
MPDRLDSKYLPPLSLSVRVTAQIVAEIPFSPVGAALMLAEVYQSEGRRDEAIGLVQQLAAAAPDEPVIRLSLCDLLLEDDDFDGVLDASAGATNDGDLGVATLHLRGAALFGLGQPGAAAEAFSAALTKTAGRDAALLTTVRLDRGIAYEAAGNKRKAKADFERVVAADPANDDARDRLAAIVGG